MIMVTHYHYVFPEPGPAISDWAAPAQEQLVRLHATFGVTGDRFSRAEYRRLVWWRWLAQCGGIGRG